MNCPKCGDDVSETYEPDDPSVGINGGWYCEACDLGIGEGDYPREPMEGDVPIMTAKEFRGDRPLGAPISALSSQPGDPKIGVIRVMLDMPSFVGSRDHGGTIDGRKNQILVV